MEEKNIAAVGHGHTPVMTTLTKAMHDEINNGVDSIDNNEIPETVKIAVDESSHIDALIRTDALIAALVNNGVASYDGGDYIRGLSTAIPRATKPKQLFPNMRNGRPVSARKRDKWL